MEALGKGLMSDFLFFTDEAEALPEATEETVEVDLHGTCKKS